MAHGPADDFAAVKVEDGGQIKPAFASLDVGDVHDPDLIGRGGFRGLGQMIGRDGVIVVAVSGLNSVAALLAAAQTRSAHEPGDAIAAMTAALLTEGLLDAWTAIRLPAAGKNGGDLPGESLVRHRARAGVVTALLPVIEAAGGNF